MALISKVWVVSHTSSDDVHDLRGQEPRRMKSVPGLRKTELSLLFLLADDLVLLA